MSPEAECGVLSLRDQAWTSHPGGAVAKKISSYVATLVCGFGILYLVLLVLITKAKSVVILMIDIVSFCMTFQMGCVLTLKKTQCFPSLAQAKRIVESLKSNRCTSALLLLQTRVDLCVHAQTLKEGDLAAMDCDSLTVHVEALKDFHYIFPLDIMAKLAAKSCLDILSKLVKLSGSLSDKNGKMDARKQQELEELISSFVMQAAPYQKDVDLSEGFERPNFDALQPSFHSIVGMIIARRQDDLNTLDWPSKLAESLEDNKQLEDRGDNPQPQLASSIILVVSLFPNCNYENHFSGSFFRFFSLA